MGRAASISSVVQKIPAELRPTSELQSGVLSSAQLTAAGLSRESLSWQVKAGHWQRPYRGVYMTFSGAPGREAKLWAAVLAAGRDAMLSHQTAAETGRLVDKPSELIHLTVPLDRRVSSLTGVVLHYSRRAAEARHPVLLPPQTRVEETVLDLVCAAGTLDNAVAWVTRALGRRLTTQARLRQAMELRAKMSWRTEIAALLSPDAEGMHSILEYRYHRDVERPHGLPEGTRQARFRQGSRNAYRDRYYPAYLTVVELDGRAAHPADERWNDVRRDNATSAGGILTLRYGWLDVTERPCKVAAEVALALATRGSINARPCSSGCPVGAVATRARPTA
jgi:hypothetical protein